MRKFNHRLGVTNIAFAGAVIVLVAIAGVGFGLYGTTLAGPSKTVTAGMTETSMMTTTHMMTETMTGMTQNDSYQFAPASGAMITNAWLLTVPVAMSEYAVSIHAEGIEVNSTYIVEGALTSGSMQNVPISQESMPPMNTTVASEFQTDKTGTGLFWIQLNSNPTTVFENVQLYLIPGGIMSNAALVATATFTMMTH